MPKLKQEDANMAELEVEIKKYNELFTKPSVDVLGKWALIQGSELIGTYNTFESAAENAVQKFGAGPYLIRQIGAPPLTLPASVLYYPCRASS